MNSTNEVTIALCQICGEPMPAGEEMFNYHGLSGDCPKSPLPKPKLDCVIEYYKLDDVDGEWWIYVHVNKKPHGKIGFPTASERDRALADLLNMQRSHGAIDVTEQ